MATISKRPIYVAKTVHGNSPWTQEFPEAASQTFLTGAIVTLNSTGHVVEAAADEVRILGVAAGAAHNDTVAATSKMLVWIADDETIFAANVSGTSVTALPDIGRGFGIVKETYWHVDKTDTTNRRVITVDLLLGPDAVGDTNGHHLFMFLSLNRALSYTS